MDAMGRKVVSFNLTQAEQVLDISGLAGGTYTVSIVDGAQVVGRGRLVVARTR